MQGQSRRLISAERVWCIQHFVQKFKSINGARTLHICGAYLQRYIYATDKEILLKYGKRLRGCRNYICSHFALWNWFRPRSGWRTYITGHRMPLTAVQVLLEADTSTGAQAAMTSVAKLDLHRTTIELVFKGHTVGRPDQQKIYASWLILINSEKGSSTMRTIKDTVFGNIQVEIHGPRTITKRPLHYNDFYNTYGKKS